MLSSAKCANNLDNAYNILLLSQGRSQEVGVTLMDRFAARTAPPTMSPDEQPYFQALGQRIAAARRNADLTQQQLADRLGISQPQLAFYEVGRRRVPVSLLPRLARALAISLEALVDNEAGPATAFEARTRRGPASRLEQQIARVSQLPKAQQKFVMQMLDTVLAQHAA